MPIYFLWRLERVCVVSISNAILWTHFVTPRGDQTQHDQTNWVSYYKKDRVWRVGIQFWPSMTLDFDLMLGACAKVEINLVCLCEEGLAGLSCAESMMHLCDTDRICWFGMDSWAKSWIESRFETSRAHKCLQRVRDVDYLPMAKLVAFSSLGNPPWLGKHDMLFCWSQVVLSEGHNFCCNEQEAMCLNNVRSGNKAVSTLWSEKRE